MKAVVITREGFIKYIDVKERSPYLRSIQHIHAIINPMKERSNDTVPVIEYKYERSFLNEFDEEILIYRETK